MTTQPEMLTAAADTPTGIGSAMAAGNAAAAAPAMFVATLGASAGSYAAAESANVVTAS